MRQTNISSRTLQSALRLLLAIATSFFLLAGFSAHASQQRYLWEDASGTFHVSPQPPPSGAYRQLELDESTDESPIEESPQPPDTHPGKASRSVAFGNGLLWQIVSTRSHSERVSPSYLFGTIHSEDPRVMELPDEVQRAFNDSPRFCMEMLLDPPALGQLTQSMLYTDGHNLQTVIGADLFSRVVPLMAERGVPQSVLPRFKPWAVFMMLSVPKAHTGLFLDAFLYSMAKQQGKSVCGLETAAEQLAIFDTAPIPDQIVLLREAVGQYHSQEKGFADMMDRYLARDVSGIVALSKNTTPTTPAEQRISAAFLKKLLEERNVRMVDRLLPRLREGGVFVAVGALHLPGQQGILRLLQDQGYRVSAVY